MLRLVARRIAIAIPVLAVIASLTFFLVQIIPGDPAHTILGQGATPEQYADLNHQLGVDRPIWVQFGAFWLNILHGDFGVSLINGLPVTEALGNALPVTLSLTLLGTIVTALLGIALGVVSAVRGGWTNRIVQGLSSIAMSVPNFWLGVLLVLVFSIALKVLPATGYTGFSDDPAGWIVGLVLPVVAISLVGVAAISRQTRSAMIDALEKPYIRALRAGGIPVRSIVYKHALRNASIPIVTSIGFQFIGVLGGTVIIEQIFALPGMGQLVVTAAGQHDLPIIQAAVLVMAALVLLVNILIDVLYSILNPRIRRS